MRHEQVVKTAEEEMQHEKVGKTAEEDMQHEKAGRTAKEKMQHEKVNIVKTVEEAMQQRLPFHHWFSTISDDATAQQSINTIKKTEKNPQYLWR